MTFKEWLNENEGFSIRIERAYDDLTSVPKDVVDHWRNVVEPWLKASYDVGYEEAKKQQENLVQSLKNEIRTQRKEIAGLREERRSIFDKDKPPGYTIDSWDDPIKESLK
jgi:hypothetical protein